MFVVFTRNWWCVDPNHKSKSPREQWPGGLIPHPRARRTKLGETMTYEGAVDMCHSYNSTHKPGRLSRKAEFTAKENY